MAWHCLFNHLYATNIARQINVWKEMHGISVGCRRTHDPQYPDKESEVSGETILANMSAKQHAAWGYLFEGLNVTEIVHEINALYLDPDYELFVRHR